MNKVSVFASAVALALGHAAYAQDELDKRFYIAPAATYTFFDGAPRDEVGAQLSIGKPVTDHLNLELVGTWTEPTIPGTPNVDATFKSIGGTLLYFPSRHIETPSFFGLLGAQAVNFDDLPGGTDDDGAYYDAGVGLLLPMTRHGTSFRTEYRYRYRDMSDDALSGHGDNVLTLGFHVPLGAAPEAPTPPPPPPPPPPPVEAPPPPPAPEAPVKEPIVLQGVNFEFDSAKLTPDAQTILNGVIDALKNAPDVNALVMGHTCNIGTSEYNLGLSNRRADSVKDYLTNGGIDGARLKTKGYGESKPLESNDTREGRQKNRRVELQVIDSSTCVPPTANDQVDEKGCAVSP